MKFKAMVLLIPLFFTGMAHADEGKRGFVMNVSVSGLFRPKVKRAEVVTVEKNSNAEKSGIKVGDKLVSVFDCKIPECSAKKAKSYFKKEAGESVFLSFVRPDGTQYDIDLVLE